jgi:hypothetical protein
LRLIRRTLAGVTLAAALAASASSCTDPQVQVCQRYDALSLTRENGFSARLDWKNPRMVDLSVERIEVALTAIRPIRGSIELVHLVGDTEADHWVLHVPDFNNSPTSLCTISAAGGASNCGATLVHTPMSPAGYYFLRAGDNTVLEAGVSFFLCD